MTGTGTRLRVRLHRPGAAPSRSTGCSRPARRVSASRRRRGRRRARPSVDVSGVAGEGDAGRSPTALGLQVRAPPKRTGRRGARPLKAPRVGALPAVDRQHGRGLDALGARAVRVPVHDAAQRRRQGRQAPRPVRRRSCSPTSSRASIVSGNESPGTRPEYRGGIGEDGVAALKAFVAGGRHARDAGQRLRPGDRALPDAGEEPEARPDARPALRARHDHAGRGRHRAARSAPAWPPATYGFYNNSPFFALTEGFASQKVSVVARYPNAERRRVGLAAGRGAHGRPRGRGDRST